MTQHSSLGPDRWRSFPVDRQILMIGNEMNRARRLQGPGDRESLRLAYERVLRLTDLTIEAATSRGLRREILRWREIVGGLYVAPAPDPGLHDAAFRVLLSLTPASAKQIPFLLS